MRRDVDIEPSQIKAWSSVDCNSAEESCEEADAHRDVAEKEDIANDAEEVGKDEKLIISSILSQGQDVARLTGALRVNLSERKAKATNMAPPKM